MASSHRELLKKFEQFARETLNAIATEDSYAGKVGEIVAATLKAEAPSVEAVARGLAMSVRNLQPKLHGEQTTFSWILNEIRKELAMGYLDGNGTPITEIAYLLGYSEVSVFYRAFKKWTNTTPSAYRRDMRQGLSGAGSRGELNPGAKQN